MSDQTKERPILFSGPLVCAILEGRKSETRRVMKPLPWEDHDRIEVGTYHPTKVDRHGEEYPGEETFGAFTLDGGQGWRCPYGCPGDRLYVRETHHLTTANIPIYRADYPDNATARDLENIPPEDEVRWRPSIHMPKWAARIWLEVTEVGVERVQEITDAGALAEGVDRTNTSIPGCARERFKRLWNEINGPRGYDWDVNPWVWVVRFRRATP